MLFGLNRTRYTRNNRLFINTRFTNAQQANK